MFNMSNRPFPPNVHPYPQFPQSVFGNTPPTSQNARLSFNQVPQNLGPGLAEAVNRSPFLKQPSQPTPQPTPQPQLQPQPLIPLPRQNFPFWGVYFQSFDQVNTYLHEVAWFPSMGRYGLPQSAEQYKFYIEKLCSALLSLQNVWDIETAPWQLGKFLPNGEWTEARDIEVIAHIVLLAAMRIHISGVTDFPHTRSIDYMSFNSEDIDFTFPQRMHFLAILLGHSKAAAAEVMARVNIDKYLAAPITALRRFDAFEEIWTNASSEEKKNLLEVQPYVGSGVTHPSPELQAQLTTMAATRYQQWYYARYKRDYGTVSAANLRGQAPGEQGGCMSHRWPPAATTEQGSPSTPGTNAGQNRAQADARSAMSGGNDRFQDSPTPRPGQNPGEGPNSSDIAGM